MENTDKNKERCLDELLQQLENADSDEISHLCDDEEQRPYLEDICDVRAAFLKEKEEDVNVDEAWQKFKTKQNIEPKPLKQESKSLNRKRMLLIGRMMIGVAAVLFLLLFFFPPKTEQPLEKPILAFTAVKQPKRVEMMCLVPATRIKHDKEQIAKTENKCIKDSVVNNLMALSAFLKDDTLDLRKVKDDPNCVNQQRMIKIPRGKEFKVILSDGSEVVLNADSKFTFPLFFTGKDRIVDLEGEAYFKIAKDSEHPFIVRSKCYNTVALGTEFNVKAYSDDVKITLINGRVSVEDELCKENVVLEPGQVVCTVNNQMIVQEVNTKSCIQWKDGYFYFEDEPLMDVLAELGRWYNVNIEISSGKIVECRINLVINKSAKIEEVVERLNEFSYLSAKMEGNRIVISKK